MTFAELARERRKDELVFMATATRVGVNAPKNKFAEFLEELDRG